jgi:hypothetical protein
MGGFGGGDKFWAKADVLVNESSTIGVTASCGGESARIIDPSKERSNVKKVWQRPRLIPILVT